MEDLIRARALLISEDDEVAEELPEDEEVGSAVDEEEDGGSLDTEMGSW